MSAQKTTPRGVLIGLAGLLGFSVLAGILVTAMVTPAIAVSGMTARNAIGIFDSLPNYIELGRQAQRNTLYGLKDGEQVPFANIYDQNREEVGWDDISQYIKDAAVDGEDRRFYEHGGVDLASLTRAALENITDTGDTGGSTIAMQLVRNILIQQAATLPTEAERKKAYREATEPTYDRKLKEIKLAISLSKKYTKQEILLGYLNIAGFGGNTYGIEAAAERYYSTSAKDVTIAQAASLIAIVQDPNNRNLDDPKKYPANKERRDVILAAMFSEGDITKAQYEEAKATPIEPKLSQPKNGCLYAKYDAQVFCDYVDRLMKDPDPNAITSLGATPKERQANWAKGGYNVYTTIDLDQQMNAKELLDKYAPNDETRFHLGATVSTVEVGTGRILVMAQNKDFNNTDSGGPTTTALNLNADKKYGQSSGFQTGSTFKIFTLAAWLQAGHGLNEYVDARPRTFQQQSFTNSCGPTGAGPYAVRNDAPGPTSATVSYALAQSINGAFVSMAQQLDLCDIKNDALAMGAHRADGQPLDTYPSFVLGTNEIAPLNMAASFSTVAAQGQYCKPIAIDKIVTSLGDQLAGETPTCNQAIAPDIANTMAYAMAGVTTGSGLGIAANPRDGTPLIGKTGTTNNARDTWMVGATTTTATAVWVGNISAMTDKNGKVLRGSNGLPRYANLRVYSLPGGSASTARHRIFRANQAMLDKTYGGEAFPKPDSNLLIGTGVTVPQLAGKTSEQAESFLESLGLHYEEGDTVASSLPAGTIVSTDPAPGVKVALGQTIVGTISDGSEVTMPNVVDKPLKKARSDLSDQGFTDVSVQWSTVTDPAQECVVLQQDPGASTTTSHDAAVTLVVGSTTPGDVAPVPPNKCD